MEKVKYHLMKQHNHKIKITYINFGHGALVYLIHFKDTNTFYIGSTNSGEERIVEHFRHYKKPNGKPNYTYMEALKNDNIEIRMLKDCSSISEAKIWETKYIKDKRKLLGNRLLNILD